MAGEQQTVYPPWPVHTVWATVQDNGRDMQPVWERRWQREHLWKHFGTHAESKKIYIFLLLSFKWNFTL